MKLTATIDPTAASPSDLTLLAAAQLAEDGHEVCLRLPSDEFLDGLKERLPQVRHRIAFVSTDYVRILTAQFACELMRADPALTPTQAMAAAKARTSH